MKNKRLLSLLLSIVMTINGLSTNTIKVVAKETDSVSISDDVDNELKINRKGRIYTYNKDGVVINFEKGEHTSDLDVRDWIKYDLLCDPYNQNIDYPDDFYLFDWAKTGEEVNITIPKEAYGNGYEIGVFINDELGKINWDDIKLTCDFVYINCLDFKDDTYDKNFLENVEACEENDIPYGLVFELDMNQYENYGVGKNDSITAKKILRKHKESLPTIFRIAESSITKENKNNPFSYGAYEFINNPKNANETYDFVKYLESFYTNFILSSANASLLQADFFTLKKLEKFIEENFDDNILDALKKCEEMWDPNSYMNYENVSITSDGIKREITRFVANENSQSVFYEYNNLYKKDWTKLTAKNFFYLFAIYTVFYWGLVYADKRLEKDMGNQLTKKKRK